MKTDKSRARRVAMADCPKPTAFDLSLEELRAIVFNALCLSPEGRRRNEALDRADPIAAVEVYRGLVGMLTIANDLAAQHRGLIIRAHLRLQSR